MLGCTVLGWITFQQWLSLHKSDRFLSASLIAKSTVYYGKSQPTTQVAQVKLEIIGDMLRDSQLEPDILAQRLGTLTAVLLSPVPTATQLPGFQKPRTPIATLIPKPQLEPAFRPRP
jgi:hypothetical protein